MQMPASRDSNTRKQGVFSRKDAREFRRADELNYSAEGGGVASL